MTSLNTCLRSNCQVQAGGANGAVTFEKGVPETQTALVALVQDWFVQNSRSGEVPEESTIRKRLAALWRKLRGEEPV